ncbi:MAG: thiamine-phosphate kinase [Deltaproteobacteria bacterium]|nr:thiamine-phosphate kinase [Deltaproteobacteria bacterium]
MAKLRDIGEFGLIQRLESILPAKVSKKWTQGIGDDTAVRRLPGGVHELFTQDILLEGVHFLPGNLARWEEIGWKALAVNLSDIAAMGGEPIGALVGLGLPSSAKVEEVEALYRGIAKCSKKYSCPVIGGDTNASKGGWVISATVLGETRQRPLLRRSARAGDSLWVTGDLGSAALGWKLMQRRKSPVDAQPFLKRFLTPEPRMDWGRLLAKSGMVGACIDVSDGLAGDLGHLSRASGLGFDVDLNRLPRHLAFSKLCASMKLKPYELLLAGGEDYELLFTVRAGKETAFQKLPLSRGVKVACIGRARDGTGIRWLEDGIGMKQKPRGFRHF